MVDCHLTLPGGDEVRIAQTVDGGILIVIERKQDGGLSGPKKMDPEEKSCTIQLRNAPNYTKGTLGISFDVNKIRDRKIRKQREKFRRRKD